MAPRFLLLFATSSLFLALSAAATPAIFSLDCGSANDTFKQNTFGAGARLVGSTKVGKNELMKNETKIYSSYRTSTSSGSKAWGYDIMVKPGYYSLKLHFASDKSRGKRFAVKVQGTLRERALNVYGMAGNSSNTPVTRSYLVHAVSNSVSFRIFGNGAKLYGVDITESEEAVDIPYRINVGGNKTLDGFIADPEKYRWASGNTISTQANLAPLYKTGRMGWVVYKIPVAKGKKYDVTLHFAEGDPAFRFPGARKFGIHCNKREIYGLDMYNLGGLYPLTYTFKSVSVIYPGIIDVGMLPQVALPVLNGITIEEEGSSFAAGLEKGVFAMNVGSQMNGFGFAKDNSTMFSNTTAVVLSTKNIVGTSAPQVFRSKRVSNGSIDFVVPVTALKETERYTVDLLFAETDGVGRRTMDIYINGLRKRTLDVLYEFGGLRPATVSFNKLKPTGSNTLEISIVPTGSAKAMLSGVYVKKSLVDADIPTPGWTMFPVQEKMSMQRRHENCAVMHNGTFYLIGGRRLQFVSKFTPKTATWGYAAPPPIEVHHVQCVTVGDRILVGMAFTGPYPNEETIDRLMWYHPKNDSWTYGATIPADRNRGSASTVAVGSTVYFVNGNIGGHGEHANSKALFDSYDVEKDEWSVLPDSPVARDHGMAAVTPHGIVVMGGRNGGTKEFFNATYNQVDVYKFDEKKWFTAAEVLKEPSGGALIEAIDDKHVILAGGEGFNNIWGRTAIFDSKEMRFVDLDQGSMVIPRHGTQLIRCKNGIYAPGGAGWQGGGPELDSIEVFTMNGKLPEACT